MKNLLKGCVAAVALFAATFVQAQSNPTPFNLNASGNYFFGVWSLSSPTGTYPANMIFHLMNQTNPTLTAVAQSNLLTGFVYSHTSGTRVQGLGVNGIQIQNATTPTNTGFTANKLGETVLGLVTSSRTQIQLSWKAQTRTTAGNVTALRCQYRIGSSGAYSDFAPLSEFMSSTDLGDETTFTVNLPANLENQALVQIRWIYYKVSGASTSSRTIRLDDISVTSLPTVTLSPIPDVCINAAPFAITDGSPSGGVYSGTGVTGGNTFDPSVSGPGTFVVTYTYTDANGISNSATSNVIVNSNACIVPIGLTVASCGATNLEKDDYIYCETAPGVQNFEYEFSGGDLSAPITRRRNSWFTDFNLSWVPQLNYGQTYDVRVRAMIGNTWGTFANVCTISLAATAPLPQLTAASCGATNLSLGNYIYTTSIVSAQDYEYKFENASLGYTGTRMRGNWFTDFNLSWLTTLRYGFTYDVSVRVKVNNVWSAFGPTCQITTMAFPTTNLTAATCSATELMPTDRIYCDPVAGATNYQYRFTPQPTGTVITRSRNANTTDLLMSWVTGITAGTTYNVEVRAYAGNTWGPWGSVCVVTTSASYSTARMNAFNPTTAAEEEVAAGTALLYPNPLAADQLLHLELSGFEAETGVVEIHDMSGRLAASQPVTLSPGNTVVAAVNVGMLEPGMYFVTIIAGEQKTVQQLVIRQ